MVSSLLRQNSTLVINRRVWVEHAGDTQPPQQFIWLLYIGILFYQFILSWHSLATCYESCLTGNCLVPCCWLCYPVKMLPFFYTEAVTNCCVCGNHPIMRLNLLDTIRSTAGKVFGTWLLCCFQMQFGELQSGRMVIFHYILLPQTRCHSFIHYCWDSPPLCV